MSSPKTSVAIDQLVLVSAKKPRNTPPALQRRWKLSNKLWEQIELLKSRINQTPFSIMRSVTIKDIEGNTKRIERVKRIRPWWFNDETGKLYVSLYYGSKTLEIASGKQAAQARDLEHVREILEILKKEVEIGTFDMAIEKASGAIRTHFDGKYKIKEEKQ
jgi:hypothetical protein